jgi:SHS family lactate transporter-like MFS transporter
MHFSNDEAIPGAETQGWRFAVASGILGWILDAFDFFVVTFLLNELAARYGVGKTDIVETMMWTLAMRPVGALLFGALADKVGRKGPLIGCVLYFSAITVCTGLAPTYGIFVLCRCLYGIGMGGYWGIGASYAMESAPVRKRGVLSGLMQAGYPTGNLLAAIGMQTIVPRFGWHAMFYVGTVLAALIIVLTIFAPESAAWKKSRHENLGHIFGTFWHHIGLFLYLLVLMTIFMALSHGTQDLYPDFLRTLPWMSHATVLGMKAAFGIPVLYNIAAVVGALSIGQLSQRIGRRRAILLALAVCLISIHWWTFGVSVGALVFGACAMQAGVQGAWGVMPAHLNELSPDAIRGMFPGVVYQLGALISSPVAPLQNWLRERLGYPWALTAFELAVITLLGLMMLTGPEKKDKDFHSSEAAAS